MGGIAELLIAEVCAFIEGVLILEVDTEDEADVVDALGETEVRITCA